MPATTTLLPASEWVPATSREPLKPSPSDGPARTAHPKSSPSPAQKTIWVPSDESLKAHSSPGRELSREGRAGRARNSTANDDDQPDPDDEAASRGVDPTPL